MAQVLLVEDDESLRLTQRLYLEQEGFEVTGVADATAAGEALRRGGYDLVVTDLRLGLESGLDVLKVAKQKDAQIEVVVITGYGSVATAVAAMKQGAYDYLTKPVDPEKLVRVIQRALERRRLRRQVDSLRHQVVREAGVDEIIAVSPAMKAILGTIDDVARSDATVLIEGESGTGKELLAKLVHLRSRRGSGPFLAINCGAMPETLLESELFGHVRGAFTGARTTTRGLFEAAAAGTLFLDEIAEITPSFQVKLLRALQERRIRRVGDTRERPVDVRIIAASNRALSELVGEGKFRQDLYFRIKVVPISIPPLRERREDILPLAESFVVRLSERMGRRRPVLSASAREKLLNHSWPGNVRELENSLERSLIFHKGDRIEAEHLFLESGLARSSPTPVEPAGAADLSLAEMERRHILAVLERCGWNKRRAAQMLGIGYNTLWRKLKRYRREMELPVGSGPRNAGPR